MVKLTIGIPYYETFDLTMRLLKTLSIQTNECVEILIIDDYCKKEFHDIKDELALNNIKLIEHNINMGVAKSRNEIIDKAIGEYIGLIDCDDLITSDYIDILLEAIDKYDTDIINFNWLNINTNYIARKPSNPAPWKAIYKKEKMSKFREDKEYGMEDVDFQAEIKEGIKSGKYSITYLDRLLYIYNSNREGSLTWKKEKKI